MPCNSEYMNPNNLEKDLTKVLYLMEELDGKGLNPSEYRGGYHPLAYGTGNKEERLQELVPILCKRLQSITNVTIYSLELQIWWRDHQKADIARLEKEQKEVKRQQDKDKLIRNLSDYEKELLGL